MLVHVLSAVVGLLLGFCGGTLYGHMLAMKVINKATEPKAK